MINPEKKQGRFAAVTILYHPDETVVKNIESYYTEVSHLFIYDNSETSNLDVLKDLDSTRFSYFHSTRNEGIAKRLNEAISAAHEIGALWLLTMDQDSYFGAGVIRQYLSCVNTLGDLESVALVSVQSSPIADNSATGCSTSEVFFAITSGSLLYLPSTAIIGPFDEWLFIDEVDHEYCLRAHQNNLKVVRMNSIFMHHQMGTTRSHRSLKSGKKTNRMLHSPFRIYHMIRNHLYVQHLYGKRYPDQFRQRRKEIRVVLKNNLIYGNDRIAVLQSIFRGIKDYRIKKRSVKYFV